MYKVLLTDQPEQSGLDVLAAYPEIDATAAGTLPPAELAAVLPAFDAIIVRSPTRLSAELIAAGKRLRVIGRAGVGVDNIDVAEAMRRGIPVLYVPGANTVSTAEHTVGMIIAVARRIAEADASLRAGRWDRKDFVGVELYGKTLGIIGFGRVGREVARRMLAFSMTLIAADPYVSPQTARQAGAELTDLDTLLGRSDVISLHVALSSETTRLVSEAEIGRMRNGALLVNCSRGEVVDENALLRGLESGKLGGVGLDVFGSEPPGKHPLFSHPRTVFTPHLGAATREARGRVGVYIAESVAKALITGEIRDGVVPGRS
jgi:D-3-phosphoglycerate dehydrogenase